MNPRFDRFLMNLRMESKAEENRGRSPLSSPDIVQTGDYVFSRFSQREGDNGVSISELIDGERKSENMNDEVKEVASKMSDYAEAEKTTIL